MDFVCNRKILMTFCTIRPLTLAVCAALPLLAHAEAEPTRTLGEVLVHSKAPADNLNLDQRASTASRSALAASCALLSITPVISASDMVPNTPSVSSSRLVAPRFRVSVLAKCQ